MRGGSVVVNEEVAEQWVSNVATDAYPSFPPLKTCSRLCVRWVQPCENWHAAPVAAPLPLPPIGLDTKVRAHGVAVVTEIGERTQRACWA